MRECLGTDFFPFVFRPRGTDLANLGGMQSAQRANQDVTTVEFGVVVG